jgi:hypothetical protein
MEHDEAVALFRHECIPAHTEEEAEGLWALYRARVDALPVRPAEAPPRLPLDAQEEQAARRFLAFYRTAPNITDVIKINPMGLVVHQLRVVLDQVRKHQNSVRVRDGWLKECLAANRPGPRQLQVRMEPTGICFDIPHAEFMAAFGPSPNGLLFAPQELCRHVSVTAFDNRMLLTAGYHRSYARISSMAPDAIDRTLVVALTTDGAFRVTADSPNQGLVEKLRGLRPPLFGDFFDDNFFMRVKLRKKRFELRVQAQVHAVDEA